MSQSRREKSVQDPVVKYARDTYPVELIARKFQAGKFGSNGWPDFDFFGQAGGFFMIEFKDPNGALSALQSERIRRLRRMGHRVWVCDDKELGKVIIRAEVQGTKEWINRLYTANCEEYVV